jgi:EAL domain-containing protein (putative c-di-GMP-specific phosphodiesterase class I)
MMRTTPERLELTSALRCAITQGELTVHYQPKFQLSNRRLIGFEALIRWRHPDRGLLPPNEFIPLAEMTDTIQPLTRWVMRTALQQLAAWQRRDHQLTMAVNLSARNLSGNDCGVTLRKIARDAGVDPHHVIVELTETALMLDPNHAEHALRRIADAGACLAIDDFGTGYSSLTHLTRFPVRELKIDQSFVATLLDSERSRAIVRSTISMARDLGLVTVAEGVESEPVAQALLEMGCDQAQGFVLGAPIPPEEVGALLA